MDKKTSFYVISETWIRNWKRMGVVLKSKRCEKICRMWKKFVVSL